MVSVLLYSAYTRSAYFVFCSFIFYAHSYFSNLLVCLYVRETEFRVYIHMQCLYVVL